MAVGYVEVDFTTLFLEKLVLVLVAVLQQERLSVAMHHEIV